MTTTTAACIRGCNIRGRHLADCEGVGPTGGECRGCLPRRAEYGLLCWPCHRRLELMLTDAPVVDSWLSGNLPMETSAAADDVKVKGSKDDPAPIKVDIYVIRQQLRDHYAEWVDWLVERHRLTATNVADIGEDSRRLLSWLDRVEAWGEIGDLWEQTVYLQSQAHALAPWRPAVRRVGSIPCPECAAVNLLIFGGESDVTCGSCGMMIPEDRFGLWEQIVKAEAGIEAAS